MSHQPPNRFIPDEIVLLIIEQISPKTLAFLSPLCLVSHQFCKLATPILYRSVELVPAQSRGEDGQGSESGNVYSFKANVIAYSREVTVENALDWDLVADLLSRMKHLDSLRWKHWDEPLPTSIVHLLSSRWPDCQLHIEGLPIGSVSRLDSDGPDQDPRILGNLLGCRNIHSVSAFFESQKPGLARRFKEFLIGCSRLEILHIKKSPYWQSQSRTRGRILNSQDLGLMPGDRLPPVKELVLETFGEEFDARAMTFWNTSKLRYLEVRGHFALKFFDQLQNRPNCVETLIVEQYVMPGAPRPISALDSFISNAKRIENLTVIHCLDLIPAQTVAIHGNTLKSLAIHQPRRGTVYAPLTVSPYYSADEFQMLNRYCPHLSSMVVDLMFPKVKSRLPSIIRDLISPKPGEYLTALAQFPKLTSLRLLGILDEPKMHHDFEASGKYPHPHIKTDTLTIHRIFSYFQKHKTGAGFEKLEVIFGQYPKNYGEGLGPEDPDRLREACDRPTVLFTCRISDRGEVLVENDCTETDYANPRFAYYFSDENLTESRPGYEYLEEFMEWNDAGEEADSAMTGFIDDDDDSLFGDDTPEEG